MDEVVIKVWKWNDAPEKYKALSTHGGDEDYIVYVPEELVEEYHPFHDAVWWNEDESAWMAGWGWYHKPYRIDEGRVIIFAHA